MRRQVFVCSLVLCMCLVVGPSVWAKGRIVVSNDEWPLSATGFSQAPDADTFVQNIASWFMEFTRRERGNFLVYSSNFGLAGSSPLCQTLRDAGHTCTVDTSLPFDPMSLQEFDGIFLAGKVNGVVPDNTVLIQYVENGGNVYLAGGVDVGDFRDAREEATAWDTFLHYFGLEFDGSAYNGVSGIIPLSSTNPLFVGVSSLYQDNGNDIHISFRSQPDTTCQPLVLSDGHILYAVCDPPSDHIVAHAFSLKFKGEDNAQSACQYYKAIKAVGDCDPAGELQNPSFDFNGWKAKNGLAVNPDVDGNAPGEVSALYFNAGDLNLARSMHGRSGGPGMVAYYVCNYRTIEDARLNRGLLACVAMESSAVSPDVHLGLPVTKFYVFDSRRNLVSFTDLDFQGPKFVPGLCVACHGGDNYPQSFPKNNPTVFTRFPEDGSGDPNLEAHFLPFDLDNFEFSTNPQLTRAVQETQFKQLNHFILQTNFMPVVEQLIQGWYNFGRRDTQRSNFVPPGWDLDRDPSIQDPSLQFSPRRLYRQVVKPSCRTCHSVMSSSLNWNRYEQLTSDDRTTPPDDRQGGFKNNTLIQGVVCSSNGEDAVMPNAEVTMNRFWRSQQPHQPDLIRRFLRGVLPGNPRVMCPVPGSLD